MYPPLQEQGKDNLYLASDRLQLKIMLNIALQMKKFCMPWWVQQVIYIYLS